MQVGKYQLIRELAVGGMAEVFLARTAGPGGFEKQLVLKRILPHLARDPAFIQMFLGEATLAARLTHPNIVQIFDFGEADGTYYLAMEYIDGPSLRTLLDDSLRLGGPLPPVVCARIIAAACEGLAFAHDFAEPSTGTPLHIVHRDISPDNLLLSRQGAVKVADFGIAKASGQQHRTQTGMIKGKLAYMPPEQIRNEALDRRVDVYSLGVVFYELVTGRRPFNAPTDASLMHEILFESATPAAQLQPSLPEPVLRILERVLAKDRAQRYPDCTALQGELEQYILSTGRPVTTQHVAQLIAQVSPPVQAAPPPALPLEDVPLTDTVIRSREPELPPRTQELPSREPPPERGELDAPPARPLVKARAAPAWKDGRLWAALGGAVLLGVGGGYLLPEGEDSLQPTLMPHTAPSETPAPAGTAPTPPPEPVEPAPGAQAGEARPTQEEELGVIIFDIKPSAVIFLQGKRLGTSPGMPPVDIPPGLYTFKFVNKKLRKSVERQIEVKAGATASVEVDLRHEEARAP